MAHHDHRSNRPTALLADKALELVMRDVLSGMSELATIAGFSPAPCEFEILEPRRTPVRVEPGATARILHYPGPIRERSADVVDFLTRRELSSVSGR